MDGRNLTTLMTSDMSYDDTDYEYDTQVVTEAEAAIITIAMPLVFIIGCLGNILTIFVILRVKEMRTVTNYFLVNLAVADLLFLIMVVPPKFLMFFISPIRLVNNFSYLGEVGCKLLSYGPRVVQGVSCFIILTLTIERYFAICWPLKFRRIRTRKKAVMVGGALWMLALVFALPHVYFPGIVTENITDFNITEKYCKPCGEGRKCDYYVIYSKVDEIIFLCIVPVLVVLYISMLMRLRTAARFGKAAHVKSSNSMAAKRQLIRMLGATVTVYLICVGCFRVFGLMILFDNNYSRQTIVLSTARVLLYINAAINPIIYNVFSKTFRTAFLKVLRCQAQTTHSGDEDSSDSVALTTTTDEWLRNSKKSFRKWRSRSRKSVQKNGSCKRPNGSYRRSNGSNRRVNVSSPRPNGSPRQKPEISRQTSVTFNLEENRGRHCASVFSNGKRSNVSGQVV
ncbi:growth hormone secretagogue receptor type 1-like [Glandiceps talaboti]